MKRWLPAGTLFVLAAFLQAADQPEPNSEMDALLRRIQTVGREGDGNVQAQKAWKALVAKGPSALVPILKAMNDDDLTAGNWLRPAFEAIAEPALTNGKLSAHVLEKFIEHKQHAGIARRLAYEWLVKLDKTAPDRLMPGMLLDPSPELRRDAVQRVMDQARASLEKKDDAAAKQLYQRAFKGACDPEQVDAIANALEKLGEKVDLQKHYGVVSRWYLIAPFDHHKGVGWDTVYPPEKEIDITASYKGKGGVQAKWVEHTTNDPRGLVDLNKVLGKFKGTVGYACAFVESPREQLVEFRSGCATGLKIFLNGKEIFARDEYHHSMRVDQYTARGTLKKGRNTILLKVCQNEQEESWAQAWRFQLRLCEPVGAAVPFRQVAAPRKKEK